jgi:Zn-dependent protease with chaperone function
MDFFEEQDRARRNTWRLVALLSIALVCLVSLTSLLLSWMLQGYGVNDTVLVLRVAAVVLGVVALGWLYKTLQLRDGGHSVALRLGGRLISLNAGSVNEKRILAVVEEMAIASGMPVPSVYVLDDVAINAFAAGLSPQDAVIGVTQGALDYLSRDELQGVIAHEFSHIFHGDMRLNLRLVSSLHGILLLGLIGRFLAGSGEHASHAIAQRRNPSDSPVAIFILLGLMLMLVGYAGTLCGRLIKAAVSRQREYLADASAVRYTRNLHGILGALKRIGGFAGSVLRARHAAEYSHLYFSQGVPMAFGGLLDTHPALEKRIRRLEPGWDGNFEGFQRGYDMLSPSSLVEGFTGIERSLLHIGEPEIPELVHAQETLASMPPALVLAAHETEGALAMLYGLMLGKDQATRERRTAWLKARLAPAVFDRLDILSASLQILEPQSRLPLLELCFPALRQLERVRHQQLAANMRDLMRSEQRVELLDWTLLRIVERNLGRRNAMTSSPLPLSAMRAQIATLLAALARNTANAERDAPAAFDSAWAMLPYPAQRLEDQPPDSLKAFDAAIRRLERLRPLQKPLLLKAMARCIEHDAEVSVVEGELFRAVADILDCPMPPLLGKHGRR